MCAAECSLLGVEDGRSPRRCGQTRRHVRTTNDLVAIVDCLIGSVQARRISISEQQALGSESRLSAPLWFGLVDGRYGIAIVWPATRSRSRRQPCRR